MVVDNISLADLDALESPLIEEPLFEVEVPGRPGDNKALWPEEERQAAFVTFIGRTSPKLKVRAVRNEGRRGFKEQRQMKRTGLLAGTFDTFVYWDVADATADCPQTLVWIEWKGFDARGRPGKLSQEQIRFGNDMTRKGFKVACFYTVVPALAWLAGLGAPIRKATL